MFARLSAKIWPRDRPATSAGRKSRGNWPVDRRQRDQHPITMLRARHLRSVVRAASAFSLSLSRSFSRNSPRSGRKQPRSCVFDHPRLIAQPDKPTVRHRIPRFSPATSPVSVMFVLCNPRMTCFFFTSSRSGVTRARVIFGKTTCRNFDLAQFQRSAPMPRSVSRYTRFRGFVKSPADE